MSQQQVDEQAFRGAVESLSPALLQIAFAFTRDADVADAIVRDAWHGALGVGDPDLRSAVLRLVFEKAWAATGVPGSFQRSVEKASGPGPTVSAARFRPHGEQCAGSWVVFPPTWPSGLDPVAALVAAALEALPDAQRAVVSLRDEQGCTADEVCEYLALGAVQQRALLHRGRAWVRQVVEEYVVPTRRSLDVGKGQLGIGVARVAAYRSSSRRPSSARPVSRNSPSYDVMVSLAQAPNHG